MAYTTIDDPESYFQTELWGGTDGSHQINFSGTNDMQPDFVWIKEKGTNFHLIFDSVRGTTKYWKTNVNEAQITNTNSLTAFGSDSFTIGSEGAVNAGGVNFIGWSWKESATAGFDILTYVGNHTSGRTVSHNLSAVPHMMIIKNLNSAEKPAVYHKGVDTSSPEDYLMVLSDGSARYNDLSFLNDTAPTSSIFTLGNTQGISESGSTMVAYLWTSIQGFSKFGSYEGNGNVDGTFVYTGFKPAFIIVKNVDASDSWRMFDNKRLGYNPDNNYLYPNATSSPSTDNIIDILSNGFKLRKTDDVNAANTYIYMAFAEAPFVNSNGVPCTAR